MFIHTNFPVSFSHESTTLLASPQFRSPVSFNLSQLASTVTTFGYIDHCGAVWQYVSVHTLIKPFGRIIWRIQVVWSGD